MTVWKPSCRENINFMVVTGVFIYSMLNSIFAIAIVDMIKTNPTNGTIYGNVTNDDSDVVRFNWTQTQKHSLFGIFMWGNLLSEFPLGRMSEIYGPRRLIGYGTLISSLLTLILPFVFQIHYNAAWGLRFIMGFCSGSLRVSLEMIAVRWFPPSERSKFMGKFVVSNIGEAFSLLCAGYVISYLGWPNLFHICGFVSLIWALAWFYLIYDTPERHPRISVAEKREILDQMNKEVEFLKKPKKLPLKQILTNGRVWALLVTFIIGAFSYFTFEYYLPTFISGVLKFNIRQNGVLASIHYIGAFLIGFLSCNIANHLIKTKKMSTTAVRKLFSGIGQFIPALLILSLQFWGENRDYCIFVFLSSFSIQASVSAGFMINPLDIGPNFASTLTSMCFVVGSLNGFAASKAISATVTVDESFESWRIMFGLLCLTNFLSGLVFVLFGSGEEQAFNHMEEEAELKENQQEELEKLAQESKAD